MVCPCGRPALENDHLCSRCRYYKTVFNPPPPVFESKRERAMRAIAVRKSIKRSAVILETE